MNDLEEILADLRTWEEAPPAPPGEGLPAPADERLEDLLAGARKEAAARGEPGLPATRDADLPEPVLPEPVDIDLPLPAAPGVRPAVEIAPPPLPVATEAELPQLLTVEDSAGQAIHGSPAPRRSGSLLPEWRDVAPVSPALPGADFPPPQAGEELPVPQTPAARMRGAPPGGRQDVRGDAALPEWGGGAWGETDAVLPMPESARKQSDEEGDIPGVPEVDLDAVEELLGRGVATPQRQAGPPFDGDEAREALADGAGGPGAGLGGGKVEQLLEKILTAIEKLGEGWAGSDRGGRNAAGSGPMQRRRSSMLEPIDLEADEGFPQASPSVSVSTVPGTGGAGGKGFGSKRPAPASVIGGGKGRPKPGAARNTFLGAEREET